MHDACCCHPRTERGHEAGSGSRLHRRVLAPPWAASLRLHRPPHPTALPAPASPPPRPQCVQRIPTLKNWLVVAIDEKLRDYCQERGIPHFYRPVVIPDTQKNAGSNHAISAMKYEIIRDFLELGWDVLLRWVGGCLCVRVRVGGGAAGGGAAGGARGRVRECGGSQRA